MVMGGRGVPRPQRAHMCLGSRPAPVPSASSMDWRASEFGSLETDQARQGWAACEGCTLQREGAVREVGEEGEDAW